jgi:TPR repeat protein
MELISMKWTRLITLSLAALLTFSSMASTLDDTFKAADQGNVIAQYNLGELYSNGDDVPQDFKQALKWYLKAADQGHADAQANLGVQYNVGDGTPQDYKQALKWYLKAADQGNANAQNNLAVLYRYGQGTPQDYKQALKWYLKAADQGIAISQNHLGELYSNGQGVPQDYKQAFKWYTKSADQGNTDAQNHLGELYSNGQGVPQDYKQALKWHNKAADQGSYIALSHLGDLYHNGQGVKKNLIKALYLYKQANTEKSKKKYIALDRILNCDNSKTKLFNVLLKCTDRETLRAAAKKAGASVKLENNKKWGDQYLTASILKGSSILTLDYTVDDFFAQAQYTFPSNMDKAQVSQVENFVANKYGAPDYANGSVSLGAVTYKWYLEDGIELKVHRGWPNTTTYLTYTYLENNQNKIAEQQRQKEASEAKNYKAQDNAF